MMEEELQSDNEELYQPELDLEEDEEEEWSEEEEWEGESERLNELKSLALKKRKEEELAKQAESALQPSLSSPTSKVLTSAWRSTIPSWGCSFFYVYIHLFLRTVLSKRLFAPLGSEWFDRPGTTEKKRDALGKKLAIPETLVVIIISIIQILLIIGILSILALIAEVVRNPLRTAVSIIGDVIGSWLSGNL